MDIASVLGIIVGFVCVIGAMIFKGISFSVFNNPAAFFVIFVGTAATILISFPTNILKNLGSLFKIIFTNKKGEDEIEIIRMMVNLSSTARKEGLLALESMVEQIEDPFIKKGIRMIVDGVPDETIEDILGTEVSAMEKRHEVNASIFSSAGMYAPTLGVLGAVFGLIAAMSHIDDTEAMAHAIGAAFMATILGIFTGYVWWNPFAKKLKVKSHEEVMLKLMVIEGLLSIQKGDSPVMLQEKLMAVLPPKKQVEVDEALKQG